MTMKIAMKITTMKNKKKNSYFNASLSLRK